MSFAALLAFSHLRQLQAEQTNSAATAEHVAGAVDNPLQTQRSLGKAYYEQGKYKEAAEAFKQVVASGRAVALDHLDFAQALIQTNQLNQALEELTTAKQMAPDNLGVRYNLGILYKHELRYTDAERELKRVIASDPNDPPTWFNLGAVLFAERHLEPAFDAFQHVVNMGYPRAQNFYVAATFHCFIILSRLKRTEDAQKFLKLNMATRNKVPGISLQYPALEAGKYGAVEIAIAPLTPLPAPQSAQELAFKEISLGAQLPRIAAPSFTSGSPIPASSYSLSFAAKNLVPLFGGSVAVGDYDGDGHPDLYIVVPGGENHLLHNNGNGTFTDVTAKAGVAGKGGSLSAAFIDYNNSGHPSLAVAGLGGVTLYKNNGNGTFTDVTAQARLKGDPGELDTRVIPVDSDNDGLLDLVVTAYTNVSKPPAKQSFSFPQDFPPATSHLYRNNGDGTFTDITNSAGLATEHGHTRGAVFADFNGDGYMDLLFYRDDGNPLLFMNQGQDKFVNRTAEAGAALAQSHVIQAAVSDFNHDGKFDLVLWTSQGYEVLLNQGDARFKPIPNLPAVQPPRGPFAQHGIVADLDGDSFDDLLVMDSEGSWQVVLNHAGRFQAAPVKFSSAEVGDRKMTGPKARIKSPLQPLWLTDPGKLDLVSMLPDGQLAVFERQGRSPRWINVKLQGYKSNKQGIGDIVELKAGNFYDKVLAHEGNSVRIFTGDLPKLDVVRVTWPNQVVQNSVDVSTDSSVSVRESERLASSCPFLYVWNGKRFVFFTDILGAAPIGELAPDGSYLRPNPQELVRLGANLMPLDGDYVFQLTDEMREVDYFDRLRLIAVDHPANEEVYSNEIYSPTPVTPALYYVRRKRFPVSATDRRGKNVLPLILHADKHYPTDFKHHRILGLAAPHSLTLNLGSFPRSAPVALWLRGWVFWTDSNASRALMANHRLTMTDPYLQVRNKAGKWVTVIPDIGLPSGTNSTMRVDLTGKFLTSDHHVRIVTNLCVYWDQIFFTTDESRATPSFALPVVSSNLHFRGFSEVKTDPNHLRPDYFEYTKLMLRAPWNPARGPYTLYGVVDTLLRNADDHLVAMSTGDEMTVKFSARNLPPLRQGWKRDFFLDAYGYAKDGEPNTAFARTAGPLPFRLMPNYPPLTGDHAPSSAAYRQYLRKYQTRPAYKLIPPLAPVGE
ncbi:MAG TPA: FG-GAP-like repeat-containing protein [Terriglobia bacterium]|nr:FG-GAP-like repeat-containing protein [Terriglobia bacterium]